MRGSSDTLVDKAQRTLGMPTFNTLERGAAFFLLLNVAAPAFAQECRVLDPELQAA